MPMIAFARIPSVHASADPNGAVVKRLIQACENRGPGTMISAMAQSTNTTTSVDPSAMLAALAERGDAFTKR